MYTFLSILVKTRHIELSNSLLVTDGTIEALVLQSHGLNQ